MYGGVISTQIAEILYPSRSQLLDFNYQGLEPLCVKVSILPWFFSFSPFLRLQTA